MLGCSLEGECSDIFIFCKIPAGKTKLTKISSGKNKLILHNYKGKTKFKKRVLNKYK